MSIRQPIDSINKECSVIMSKLIDISEIESTEFTSGNGYVQHNKDVVNEVTESLIRLAYHNGYCGDEKFIIDVVKYIENDNFRQDSIIGRYLDGTQFYKHWYRLMCIDYNGREFGQPFFAINPDKSPKLEPLNKFLRAETINKLLDE